MKKILALVLVFVLLTLLSACGKPQESGYPLSAEGVTLTQQPKAVAVLSEGLHSVLYDLGFENIIKASTDYKEKCIANAGTAEDVLVNNIIAAKCELVITNEELFSSEAEILSQNNVQVVVIPVPDSVDKIEDYYIRIGRLLGGNKGVEKAKKVFASLKTDFEKLQETSPKTAAFMIDEGSLAAKGLVAELITLSGYENVVKNVSESVVSADILAATDPEVIFCAEGLSQSIRSNPKFLSLSAVKNDKVFEIDTGDIYTASLPMILAAFEMHNHSYSQVVRVDSDE